MRKKRTDFRLMVITNHKSAAKNIEKIVNDCFRYGVKAVQLREKDLPGGRLLEIIGKVPQPDRKRLIINDRLDIALLANAKGIHLPGRSIPLKHLEKYRKTFIFGRSVHSLKQAKLAEKEGFDYILFGPVFKTPAKVKYGSPQGLKKLNEICSAVSIPVYGVGGINPLRVKKCIDSGAYGVAVINAVMRSPDIKKTINEFKNELGSL